MVSGCHRNCLQKHMLLRIVDFVIGIVAYVINDVSKSYQRFAATSGSLVWWQFMLILSSVCGTFWAAGGMQEGKKNCRRSACLQSLPIRPDNLFFLASDKSALKSASEFLRYNSDLWPWGKACKLFLREQKPFVVCPSRREGLSSSEQAGGGHRRIFKYRGKYGATNGAAKLYWKRLTTAETQGAPFHWFRKPYVWFTVAISA